MRTTSESVQPRGATEDGSPAPFTVSGSSPSPFLLDSAQSRVWLALVCSPVPAQARAKKEVLAVQAYDPQLKSGSLPGETPPLGSSSAR